MRAARLSPPSWAARLLRMACLGFSGIDDGGWLAVLDRARATTAGLDCFHNGH